MGHHGGLGGVVRGRLCVHQIRPVLAPGDRRAARQLAEAHWALYWEVDHGGEVLAFHTGDGRSVALRSMVALRGTARGPPGGDGAARLLWFGGGAIPVASMLRQAAWILSMVVDDVRRRTGTGG